MGAGWSRGRCAGSTGPPFREVDSMGMPLAASVSVTKECQPCSPTLPNKSPRRGTGGGPSCGPECCIRRGTRPTKLSWMPSSRCLERTRCLSTCPAADPSPCLPPRSRNALRHHRSGRTPNTCYAGASRLAHTDGHALDCCRTNSNRDPLLPSTWGYTRRQDDHCMVHLACNSSLTRKAASGGTILAWFGILCRALLLQTVLQIRECTRKSPLVAAEATWNSADHSN